jgi:hypothetical protein
MVTKFVYRYNNENLKSQWEQTCSLSGSASCRQAWINEYPINSVRPGWINPENPIHVEQTNEVRKPRFTAFVVFAVFSLIFTLVGYGYTINFLMTHGWCDSPQVTDNNKRVVPKYLWPLPVKSTTQQTQQPEEATGDNVAPPPGGYNFQMQPVLTAGKIVEEGQTQPA